MSSHSAMTIDRVSKSYRSPTGNLEILKDVSLSALRGDLISIQGVSGSGKSTLLNVIGGLTKADAGSVAVEGHDLTPMSNTELAHFRRRHLGFVFQRFNLLSGLTVLENVVLPLRLIGESGRTAVESATESLLRVNLANRLRHRVSELSSGEMQRVAIARAIVHKPTVLLADEPTGNLDADNKSAILDVFEGLSETAVLIVTHDQHVASRCTARYTLMAGVLERAT